MTTNDIIKKIKVVEKSSILIIYLTIQAIQVIYLVLFSSVCKHFPMRLHYLSTCPFARPPARIMVETKQVNKIRNYLKLIGKHLRIEGGKNQNDN